MVPRDHGTQSHSHRHRQALIERRQQFDRRIGALGMQALSFMMKTEESKEEVRAFNAKASRICKYAK